jgi:predicted acyltransferase
MNQVNQKGIDPTGTRLLSLDFFRGMTMFLLVARELPFGAF